MSRILVAEDDLAQACLRKILLEQAGHEVVVATDPSGTLRRLERDRPDVLLMDLRYPNAMGDPDAREGMALIRRIREAGWNTPVVVISGWPDQIYGAPEERMVSLILVKPVPPEALLRAIAELLA